MKKPEFTNAPLIYSAITKVMSEVGAIGKNNRAGGSSSYGYNFRGIDDMYNALNSLLAEAGVFFVSEITNKEIQERETKDGKIVLRVIIHVKWTAYAQDGSFLHTETL
jgi:hypothetical protein